MFKYTLAVIAATQAAIVTDDNGNTHQAAAPMSFAIVSEPTHFDADYFLEGVKGLSEGFYHGLYKSAASTKCMDETTEKNIEAVIDDLMDLGNIQSKMFKLMGQVTEIQQGMSECHFEVVALDMMHYCAAEQSCGFGSLAGSVQQNMFTLMGKFTSLSEIVGRGLPEDAATAKMQGKQLGEDIGDVIQTLTGFKKVEELIF